MRETSQREYIAMQHHLQEEYEERLKARKGRGYKGRSKDPPKNVPEEVKVATAKSRWFGLVGINPKKK